MADRTPSTWSTSSSRIVVGSVAVSVAGDADTRAGAGTDAGPDTRAGIDGVGAIQDDGDEVDGSGGMPLVIHDPLESATALTFSIRTSYRHRGARLEGFLTKPDQPDQTTLPLPHRHGSEVADVAGWIGAVSDALASIAVPAGHGLQGFVDDLTATGRVDSDPESPCLRDTLVALRQVKCVDGWCGNDHHDRGSEAPRHQPATSSTAHHRQRDPRRAPRTDVGNRPGIGRGVQPPPSTDRRTKPVNTAGVGRAPQRTRHGRPR